jgi:methyl-accepting chemotaxis protein
MPLWKNNSSARDALAQAAAIGRSQAVIEFKMDGTIVTANQNFLDAMGYRLDEIVGKHHRMFVTPEQRDNPDYHAFWAKLNRGEYPAAEYKRVGKGGREVWIQASYNPILDSANRSSSSPPTSPSARSATWRMPARSRRSPGRKP